MESERLIPLQELCSHYNIEISFIRSLNEFGLVEIHRVSEEDCLNMESLADVESMMRIHYDLEINMEGIDAISHLLKKMHDMQQELLRLRNKLD
jgi:hypothetical protein